MIKQKGRLFFMECKKKNNNEPPMEPFRNHAEMNKRFFWFLLWFKGRFIIRFL